MREPRFSKESSLLPQAIVNTVSLDEKYSSIEYISFSKQVLAATLF
jgi:hypothetical protein